MTGRVLSLLGTKAAARGLRLTLSFSGASRRISTSVLLQPVWEAGDNSLARWPGLSLCMDTCGPGLPHEVGIGHVIVSMLFSCGKPTHLFPRGLPPSPSDLELGTCLALANSK